MRSRVLYFDCAAGVSGDMVLGALVDAGVPLKALEAELEKLHVGGFRLVRSKARRGGIRGTRIRVAAPEDRGYRHLRDFERVLRKSALRAALRDRSLALVRRIFEAEAAVHGESPESVHLHELGSLDTLVDIVGAVCGVALSGADRVEASPVNLGSGFVDTEHGRLSVPAPATALLLKGVPVFSEGAFERTTPTGAVIVTELAERFGPMPSMILRKVGYGLGTRNPSEGSPNALRVILGEVETRASESLVVLEATIDDATPEQIGYVQERLAQSGVVDVWVTPVTMKKSRPGVQVSALVHPKTRDEAVRILFQESTTLGVRAYSVEREVLERRFVPVSTPYGRVRMKEALRGGRVVNVAPEYEDCRRLARKKNVPLKRIQEAAFAAYEGS